MATCDICEQPVRGRAELTDEAGVTIVVVDCPVCHRYAIPPEVAPLLRSMNDATRWNLLARLETRSIAPAPDGTVVLRPEHVVAPRGG